MVGGAQVGRAFAPGYPSLLLGGGLSPSVRASPPGLEGIGPRLTGTAVGFVFAVGEVGGVLSPVLIGTLRDVTGSFAPGLAALAAAGPMAAGAGAAMGRG